MRTIKVADDERMAAICAALLKAGVTFEATHHDGLWHIDLGGY